MLVFASSPESFTSTLRLKTVPVTLDQPLGFLLCARHKLPLTLLDQYIHLATIVKRYITAVQPETNHLVAISPTKRRFTNDFQGPQLKAGADERRV